MSTEGERNMKPPPWRFEWNPNTILGIVQLAAIILFGGYFVNDIKRDIRSIQEWRVEHEMDGKERRAMNSEGLARLSQQAEGMKETAQAARTDIDRNTYRIGQLEAQAATSVAAQSELSKAIGELSSEVRVSREILQRIETAQRNRP